MSVIQEMRELSSIVGKAREATDRCETKVDAVTPSAQIFTVRVKVDITKLTDKSAKEDASFRFEYPDGTSVEADGNIKLQGAGSIRWYPHCNYTINKLTTPLSFTTYDGEQAAPNLYQNARTRHWGSRKKFVLKADHMDHTHARNIVSARLWGDVVRSRHHKLLPVMAQPDDWAETYDNYYRFSATTERYVKNTSETFLSVYNYYTKTNNGQPAMQNEYYPLTEKPLDWEENYTNYWFFDASFGIIKNTHSTFEVYTYKIRDPQSPLDKLLTLPNCGAVDGFPCRLFINDEYRGLYVISISKDENMLGMGEGTSEAILCGEDWVELTRMNTPEIHNSVFEFDDGDLALISQSDYERYVNDGTAPGKAWVIEYDEDNCEWIPSSFNEVLDVVYDYDTYPDGETFKTAFESVFDEKSAIDYLIFIRCLGLVDNYARNVIMAKYDGGKWFCSAYDMDTAFGIFYLGSSFYSVSTWSEFYSNMYTNETMRLWKRLLVNYHDEIKERYNELRENAMSNYNVIDKIIGFCKEIPDTLLSYQGTLYDNLYKRNNWPVLPGTGASNMYQMICWYQEHMRLLDENVNNF